VIDFDYQKLGAGYYDEIFEKDRGVRRFWHEIKFKMIESCLACGPQTRILDAGCASGSFLGRLKAPFQQAVGIDISTAQIEYARKKYGSDRIQFFASDIAGFRWEGPLFDYVILSEVLEHLNYDTAFKILRKLRSFLKPAGKLVMTTPNYRSLWPLTEFFVNRLSPVSYEHQHINKLDCAKLERLLLGAGFRPEKIQTFFIAAPFSSFLSYRLARWLTQAELKLLPRAGSIILSVASLV
jgi:2-polyprenyl-3-methyl-5-hydroxy-6-metoxy-1,4-benzoquinol methylase